MSISKMKISGLLLALIVFVGCNEEELLPSVSENSLNIVKEKENNNWNSDKKDHVPASGCTRTIGFWKNHKDDLEDHLPVWLGEPEGKESLYVEDVAEAKAILSGSSSNGILKLYAQLLATRLNINAEASEIPLEVELDLADSLLSLRNADHWVNFTKEEMAFTLELKDAFDNYNNGGTDIPHCDDINDTNPVDGTEPETPGETDSGGEEDEEETV